MRTLLLLGFMTLAHAAPLYPAHQSYGYVARHTNVDYYQPQQPHHFYGSATNAAINVPYYTPEPAAPQTHHQPPPIVTKRFYLHSAPEEPAEDISEQLIKLGQPRKTYNIVFIKAPAAQPQRTLLKIQPTLNEERTIIYVLSKKPVAPQIEAHVYDPPTTTSKPEVFFIKYKTAEEATAAQQTIQAQYDHLGGSTEINHEPPAPVTSVIGSLQPNSQQATHTEAYLPVTKK